MARPLASGTSLGLQPRRLEQLQRIPQDVQAEGAAQVQPGVELQLSDRRQSQLPTEIGQRPTPVIGKAHWGLILPRDDEQRAPLGGAQALLQDVVHPKTCGACMDEAATFGVKGQGPWRAGGVEILDFACLQVHYHLPTTADLRSHLVSMGAHFELVPDIRHHTTAHDFATLGASRPARALTRDAQI